MLIDEVSISVSAGDGGRGAVAFTKNLMSLGPAGGSGGHGGSVYLEGVSDLGALRQFRYVKKVAAEDGQHGKLQFNDGHDGKDLVLKVPVGTVLHFSEGKSDLEITKIGERILVARGGRGGRGNFHFRSSTNTSPKEFEEGRPGEKFSVRLELKLIADVGFVGFPNVGKSSLLNELTRASAKVANYPFTTLEPNLGAYYDLILADIPGLIEGASSGKGLGTKFLRHIERTRILFHFVSSEAADPLGDYKIVRQELAAHNPALIKKKEHLFLTKSDMVSGAELVAKLKVFKKIRRQPIAISIYDDEALKRVREILNVIADEKRA